MAKLFQRSLKAQKSDPVAPTEAQRTAAVTQTADSDHQQKVERIRQEMAEKRRSMEDALHKEFEDKKAKIHAGWQSRLNEEKFRADKEIKEAKDRADKEKGQNRLKEMHERKQRKRRQKRKKEMHERKQTKRRQNRLKEMHERKHRKRRQNRNRERRQNRNRKRRQNRKKEMHERKP